MTNSSNAMVAATQAVKSFIELNKGSTLSAETRITTADKKIILGNSDVNQIIPIKYNWAWQKYIDACANHWMPSEVNMSADIATWKSDDQLTTAERRAFERNFGFFATADTMVANNLILGIYANITAAECRQYICRQIAEEAIHCFIDGTEILTNTGFVDFNDITETTLFPDCTFSGKGVFTVASDIIHSEYTGKIYSYVNDLVSQHVTPNHRMVFLPHGKYTPVNGDFVFTSACDVDQYVDSEIFTIPSVRYDVENDGIMGITYKTTGAQLCDTEQATYDYAGKIHCVTVPCGMVVVRHNGKISLSGNSHAYQYVIQSLGMDEARIFNMYREIPSISNKMQWALKITEKLASIVVNDLASAREFTIYLSVYCCVVEGLFFYTSFCQILTLKRRNLMSGSGEQIEYILRDEGGHINFGVDVINQIKNENAGVWSNEVQDTIRQLFLEGFLLEVDYIRDTIPVGYQGMNANQAEEYLKFMTNRRLVQLGLDEEFPGATNPYPWMSEMIDLRKEKNFFETRVTDYQVGALGDWE